jgi:hypothetical protein
MARFIATSFATRRMRIKARFVGFSASIRRDRRDEALKKKKTHAEFPHDREKRTEEDEKLVSSIENAKLGS